MKLNCLGCSQRHSASHSGERKILLRHSATPCIKLAQNYCSRKIKKSHFRFYGQVQLTVLVTQKLINQSKEKLLSITATVDGQVLLTKFDLVGFLKQGLILQPKAALQTPDPPVSTFLRARVTDVSCLLGKQAGLNECECSHTSELSITSSAKIITVLNSTLTLMHRSICLFACIQTESIYARLTLTS